MLPSVVDDPARALNSETWEDLGREFLWSHARFGIVDHAVRKNARANNGPLAGYLARDSLYIRALCPVDHGPPHGDPSQIGPGRGGEGAVRVANRIADLFCVSPRAASRE